MRFKPGNRIRFVTADGVELMVKPFFYTSGNDSGLKYELLTDDGTRLDSFDDEKGIYRLGASGGLVYLQTDSARV
jgi:hypothetical protein